MTIIKPLLLVALASFVGTASAGEFPLPWICLAITVVGVIFVFIIAGRHPDELQIPGAVVMTGQELEYAEGMPRTYSGYEQEPVCV